MTGKRPCIHSEGPIDEKCLICGLYVRRADYREFWATGKSQDRPKPGPFRSRPDCIHLGKSTGERVLCKVCKGHVELFIFSCEVHGRCTRGKMVDGIKCCETGCLERVDRGQ